MNVPHTISEKLQGTFESRIIDLLETQYGVVSGDKIKKMFAKEVATLANECLVSQDRLDTGQIIWSGIAVDERNGYGKNAKNMTYHPVVLDLFTKEDLEMISSGFSFKERRKWRVVRLFEDAYRQGAVLSHSDVAFMMNVSTGTVGKDIKQYMEESDKVVHTRGIVHDIGPTLTHKSIIVKLWYQGLLEPEIIRKTDHSMKAITRYIKGAQRVEEAMTHTEDPRRIGQLVGMTPRLVSEYIAIIKEAHEERRDNVAGNQ